MSNQDRKNQAEYLLERAVQPGAGRTTTADTWDTEQAVSLLAARAAAVADKSFPSPTATLISNPQARRTRSWRLVAGGAAAVGVLGLAAVLGTHTSSPQHGTTYTTRAGEQTSITLPDGSQVQLNVASTLQVPADFGGSSRTVKLSGEARFVVEHDAESPFIVMANGTQVRDLATDFVVQGYPESATTTIAVRDGKVAVQSPRVTSQGATVVEPDQSIVVAANGAIRLSRTGAEQHFAWTEGSLVLLDVPSGEALAQLSRWFGLEFRVTDSTLLDERVTMTMPRQLTQEYLTAVAALFNATAICDGNVVTLTPR